MQRLSLLHLNQILNLDLNQMGTINFLKELTLLFKNEKVKNKYKYKQSRQVNLSPSRSEF